MLFRKTFALTLFVFVALFTGQNICRAQNKPSKKLYAEPSRLMFSGDENEEAEATQAILLREYFYPIGWSKDGKFAYYSEPADEACGCYFADLIIQDMRNDKILWTFHFESEEDKGVSIETLWRKKRREFSRKLAQYGIVAQKNFKLENPSINYKDDIFTPEIKFNINEESDFLDLKDVALRMNSKKLGSKLIYEQNYNPKEFNGILHIEIAGSLLSPFEARAAVIVVETHRGWEGPPNVTEIKLVGASLTTGFR